MGRSQSSCRQAGLRGGPSVTQGPDSRGGGEDGRAFVEAMSTTREPGAHNSKISVQVITEIVALVTEVELGGRGAGAQQEGNFKHTEFELPLGHPDGEDNR